MTSAGLQWSKRPAGPGRPTPVLPGWSRETSYRLARGEYRIIEVSVGKRLRYCAQWAPERRYFGLAESWHDTLQQAADWCDNHQRVGGSNVRAGE